MKLTVPKIAERLQTEADAYLLMEELRWGDGEPICPHCDNIGASYIQPTNGVSRKTRTGAMSERRVWRCLSCRKQFSVLTGTIFHGTKVPLRTWVLVVFEMCASKNGIAAREVERKYGVCARTAWHMMHRIREAMTNDVLITTMRGTIVADETWIGGNPVNRHQRRYVEPVPVIPGENLLTDKTNVLSLVNAETGEVRSRIIPDVSGATLRKVIAEQVDMAGSVLHTDQSKSYLPLAAEFIAHEAVNHSEGEYVRGVVSTNKAENYFSQLKRSIDGTHHRISREHLPRYLAEFDYRFSTRKMSDTARMHALMGRVAGRRLSYKRITHALTLFIITWLRTDRLKIRVHAIHIRLTRNTAFTARGNDDYPIRAGLARLGALITNATTLPSGAEYLIDGFPMRIESGLTDEIGKRHRRPECCLGQQFK